MDECMMDMDTCAKANKLDRMSWLDRWMDSCLPDWIEGVHDTDV